MARLLYNNQGGLLGANPGSGGTTITFAIAPNFATITGSDYIPLVLDAGLATMEIVYLTAYTAAATTGTITRAAEDSANWPAVAHPSGTWVCAPTIYDIQTVPTGRAYATAATTGVTTGGYYPINLTSTSFLKGGMTFSTSTYTNGCLVVPTTGVYKVVGQVSLTNNNSASYTAFFTVGGSVISQYPGMWLNGNPSTWTRMNLNFSDIQLFTEGQQIGLGMYQNTGGNIATDNTYPTNTWLALALLSL